MPMKKFLPIVIAAAFALPGNTYAQADYSFKFSNLNNEAVALADSNIYYPSAHGFTWELWINPDSIPVGNDTLEDVNRSQAFLSVEDGIPADDIAIGIGWGEVPENWL